MLNLTTRELEIMIVIYSLEEPCALCDIVKLHNVRFPGSLKVQTIQTCIRRLEKKNWVASVKHGFYQALVSKQEFLRLYIDESVYLLNNLDNIFIINYLHQLLNQEGL